MYYHPDPRSYYGWGYQPDMHIANSFTSPVQSSEGELYRSPTLGNHQTP